MSKRYILLALILLGAAYGLTILPEKPATNQIPAKDFLIELNNSARYLSTHQIAKRIIERDPSIFLIDVRTTSEFEEYAIPGAFNIPLETILSKEWTDYLSQEGMDVVLYSNGDIYADQAWTLISQQGVENLYIMKGGVNQWFSTIIQPVKPPETAPSESFDLYSFERAASIYFGGSPANVESTTIATEKKQVVLRKKKKKAAEGGC